MLGRQRSDRDLPSSAEQVRSPTHQAHQELPLQLAYPDAHRLAQFALSIARVRDGCHPAAIFGVQAAQWRLLQRPARCESHFRHQGELTINVFNYFIIIVIVNHFYYCYCYYCNYTIQPFGKVYYYCNSSNISITSILLCHLEKVIIIVIAVVNVLFCDLRRLFYFI